MLKLGVIGCGSVASRSHIEGLKEIATRDPSLFDIVATCDIREEAVRKFADQIMPFQKQGVPKVYADYRRMIENESLDAVSIAVPHFAHHETAIYALNAGLHVLIEKPFAITIKAGQNMITAAEKNRCVLACVHPLRRKFASRLIDWTINRARLIGDPRFFFYMRIWESLGVLVGTPWRYNKIQAGGGWLLDGEVHTMDFLRMLFGDVSEVYARTKNYEPLRYMNPMDRTNPVPSDVEDIALVTLTFKNGVIGSLIWTNSAIGEKPIFDDKGSWVDLNIREQTIDRFYGSEGSVEYTGYGRNVREERVDIRTLGGGKISHEEVQSRFTESLTQKESDRIFPLGMKNEYAISCYNFFDSIINNRNPEVSGRDALVAQAICYAAYESSALGQAVHTGDIIEGRVDSYEREINGYWKI